MREVPRRYLIQSAPTLVVAISGCTSKSMNGNSNSTEDSLKNDSRTSKTNVQNSTALGHVYISEIVANPEGADVDNLNEESIAIETNADSDINLSDYSISIGQEHNFRFPDELSQVGGHSYIKFFSGAHDPPVVQSDYPDYRIYLGSSEPLLSNDGMTIKIVDNQKNIVDEVTYDQMKPGDIWIRPE